MEMLWVVLGAIIFIVWGVEVFGKETVTSPKPVAKSLPELSSARQSYENLVKCSCGGSGYVYRCSNWPKKCKTYELSYRDSDRDEIELYCPKCEKAKRKYFLEKYQCSDCYGTGRPNYTTDY
jgi:hypothetical protein